MSKKVLEQHEKTLVLLDLTHNYLDLYIPQAKFSLLDRIIDVKGQLERRFGSQQANMKIVLKDKHQNILKTLEDDFLMLRDYDVEQGMILHCVDQDPNSMLKEIGNSGSVQKYVMNDDDYDKLNNSVRKYKQWLIKNNPELFRKQQNKIEELNNNIEQNEDKSQIESFQLDQRCEIISSRHRGKIAYIGKVPDLDLGYFIGIILDEPFGNTNGTINGVKYFETYPKYGLFLRPFLINVGDFPPIDEFDEL